jgi:hypothetical protein
LLKLPVSAGKITALAVTVFAAAAGALRLGTAGDEEQAATAKINSRGYRFLEGL